MQSSLFKINVLIPASIVWLLCISEFRRKGVWWGGGAQWSVSAENGCHFKRNQAVVMYGLYILVIGYME
jgi:hypothetical protein